MAYPRCILPGKTWFLTRRCTQRQFLLRPGKRTNQAYLYCLAEAAERHGIVLVSAVAMSNHSHVVCIDARGELSAFLQRFHMLLSKVMNCHLGRWENFWAAEPTCSVRCVGADDAFGKMIYGLTNPVKAQLVQHARDWPGASSLGAQLSDKTLVVERPRWFFDAEGSMPEVVTLRFGRPRGFEHLSQQAWADKIREAVSAAETAAMEARRRGGGRVLGRRAVLKQSPFGWPGGFEPRRNVRPEVACRSKWHRIDALRQNKRFRRRYAAALALLKRGVRDVMFPAGTWQLRVRGLVDCEPFPAPS